MISDDVFSILPYGKKRELHRLSNLKNGFVVFKNHEVDLVKNKTKSREGKLRINFLLDSILNKKSTHILCHAFYEMGYFQFEDLYSFIPEDKPLFIFLEFEEFVPYVFENQDENKQWKNKFSYVRSESPSLEEYTSAFKKGRDELFKGNCYQFNLTFPFRYKTKKIGKEDIVSKYINHPKRRGEFSSFTFIKGFEKAIWSNSPESLFQLREKKDSFWIQSRPIKGTNFIKDFGNFDEAWKDLSLSKKNQAELFMITDMLRNDLNRIEKPCVKVPHKKVPLSAPGLVHQMSLVEIEISKNNKFSKIFNSIFPGGSITGAPKKRVMAILKGLEIENRGIYCGSTILSSGNKVDCSINIRTADFDLSTGVMTYGAGGGVTVLSDLAGEFQEMQNKVLSFESLLDS